MEIEKLIIKDNPLKGKRLKAEIYLKGKKKPLIRRFGAKTGYTFFDGGDDNRRDAYIARHSKLNEDWGNITTPAALSRYVLWEKQGNQAVEKLLNRMFKIPIVKVNITKNKKKE